METNLEMQKVEETKPMSFFEKLIGIFVSPTKVFENIKEYPKMLWPIVFVSMVTMLTGLVRMPLLEITLQRTNNMYMERYNMDLASMQAGAEGASEIGNIVGIALSPITVCILWAMGSVILWGISKLFKGKADLKQILSLNAHVMMLSGIGALLAAPLGLLLQTDISVFSLGILLMDIDPTSFIHNLAQMIDIFGIWTTVLTAFGLSIISDFTKLRGYILSFLLYIGGVLFAATAASATYWILDRTMNL